MTISAFGVEHSDEIAKKAPKTFDTSRGEDPKGYRQGVGNQLNPRSGVYHKKGSLGRRAGRVAGYGAGAGAAGAALGAAAGALAGKSAGISGQTARLAASVGGGAGAASGRLKALNVNREKGDTAAYRRGGKKKGKKSAGKSYHSKWEVY
jgi:hypothetical protein